MDRTEIIILLKKIVDKKMLEDDISIMNANMCIDALTYGGMEDRDNVRMMAINIIKRAGLIELENLPNRFDTEKRDNELLNEIPKLVEEIRGYLATRQLDSNLALCLEFVIEDLTNEQLSKEQKLEVIQKYYREYEPAITSTDEYIPKSSNHGK